MEGGEGRGGREGRGGGGWGKRGEGLASPAPASRSPAARRRRIGCVRGREFPRRRAVECFQMGTECFQSGLVSISCHGPPPRRRRPRPPTPPTPQTLPAQAPSPRPFSPRPRPRPARRARLWRRMRGAGGPGASRGLPRRSGRASRGR